MSDRCDVLIVGGGPAGSACARQLITHGLDVVVLDRSPFPRDKVCAGWITPAVVRAAGLDLADYARQHTLQPFFGFRTGLLSQVAMVTTRYDTPISYGIRRCELDTYLLRRTGARLRTGESLETLVRDGHDWVINDTVRASAIVGAGGHFCPVSRQLNAESHRRAPEPVVVAQEVERPLSGAGSEACHIQPGVPELYFWPDLMGYGWSVRKGSFLNVGVGRLTQAEFPAAVAQFKQALSSRHVVPPAFLNAWKGHAYLLNATSTRRVHGDGIVLAGDAAGLALAPSGEGILAAVESGLMAADTLLRAAPRYSLEDLAPYAAAIDARFAPRGKVPWAARLPSWLLAAGGRAILQSPALTRRWLLERAFLHHDRRAMSIGVPPLPAVSAEL